MAHLKEKVIDFLRNHFFHRQFDKIRFFIEHFNSPRFKKKLDGEKEIINTFTMLDNSVDGRGLQLECDVLHYAICYGDHNNGIL